MECVVSVEDEYIFVSGKKRLALEKEKSCLDVDLLIGE